MKELLRRVKAGRDLLRDDARQVFGRIMGGAVDDGTLTELLTGLADKGESVDEIVGAALAMRERVTPIRCDAGAIDTCGTGGDGISTFNVSTTAAIIAAAAGATVAKHGNRTNTRVSGSAEVLEALGVNIDADPSTVVRCLQDARVGFLYARALHPAMRHAAGVRAAIGRRTIFNLLGPLVNPAGVRRQLIGVPRPELTELLATALRELGAERAWVVHGLDGLCDLTATGPTRVTELAFGSINTFEISPEQCGLAPANLEALCVDSPAASAVAVRDILAGVAGPRRDHALLNAGAALVVAEKVEDLPQGVTLAAEAVDNGAAAATLDLLAARSQGR
ncbi:MAG: anthranilate phosphoribosyltransferase [bacterium]|nr:anthranilate phosphoribosyltransferase [bacterium]